MDVKVDVPASFPGAACSLGQYMTLPVSHYTLLPLPLGATLTRVGTEREDLFALTIPRVQLFSLAVQPTITVSVRVLADGADEPCVLITVVESRVDGAWADQLRLNERFLIWGTTRFSWPTGDGIRSVTDLRVGVDPPHPFSAIPKRILVRVGNAVLNAVCAHLQRVFIRALAADYRAWAGDDAYRERRARGELECAVAGGEFDDD